MKLESEPVVVGAVGKVKIQPLLRDFQAEGESPALGLFHGAAFSTALLPTNSAKEPYFWRVSSFSNSDFSTTLAELLPFFEIMIGMVTTVVLRVCSRLRIEFK